MVRYLEHGEFLKTVWAGAAAELSEAKATIRDLRNVEQRRKEKS